jgi:hypothetical protein
MLLRDDGEVEQKNSFLALLSPTSKLYRPYEPGPALWKGTIASSFMPNLSASRLRKSMA